MVGLLTGLIFFPVLLSLAGPAAEVSRFLIYNRKKISHTKLNVLLSFVLTLKGKAIPLQAWTCLEGSRRLRLSDFKAFGT
jgi:hypothetical protein